MKKKNNNKIEEQEFKVNDYVGAKVKGYALWPGIIEKVENLPANRKRYTVRFFGTDEIGTSFVELKLFKDFSAKELACNKKGFKEALELCKQSYDNFKKTNDNLADKDEERGTLHSGDVQESPPTPSSSVHEQSMEIDLQPQVSHVQKEEGKEADGKKQKLQSESNTKPKPKLKLKKKAQKKIENQHQQQQTQPSKSCLPLSPESSSPNEHDASANGNITVTKCSTNDLRCEQTRHPDLGGNVMQLSEKEQNLILAKLEEKVEAKVKEKEIRKQQLKERRLSEKVSEKFSEIYPNLEQLSKVSKTLRKNASQLNPRDWKLAVRNHEACLGALERCIQYFMTDSGKGSDARHKCHKTLLRIADNLQEVKMMKSAPESIDVRKVLKGLRDRKIIFDFIRESNNTRDANSKNAMTERKENDAVKLKKLVG